MAIEMRAVAGFCVEIGEMARLLVATIKAALKPPYSYGAEFLHELRFAINAALLPLILMSFALSFGPAGVQGADFLGLFGALDRFGGIYVLVTVREFAPLVTAIILAGAVGTAICADLGAREVREETSALRVMAIDPIKSLVVPRLLTMLLLSVLFNIVALISGMAGAVLVIFQNHAPLGPFFATFFANATPLELGASFVKCLIYGTVIATVCCYKGLNVSGGPEGVGRSVNQSVVIAFLAIGAIDYTFTQYLLATHPILSEVR